MKRHSLFIIAGAAAFGLTLSAHTQQGKSLAPTSASDLVGTWEGSGKVGLGGTGQSKVQLDLQPDGTFELALRLFEPAHVLNAYPTSDEIRALGTWKIEEHGTVTMTATITKFVSSYQVDEPGSPRKTIERQLEPDPKECTLYLRVTEDGSRSFVFVPLEGIEEDSTIPVSKFVGPVPMAKTKSTSGNASNTEKIESPGADVILVGTLVRVEDGDTFWLGIRPETPIRFVAFEGEPMAEVEVLQIAGLEQAAWDQAIDLVGKTVRIEGSLMEAHTRYHNTAALIVASSVEKVP